MRKYRLCHVMLALIMVCALWQTNATAWGTRSMRSITAMGLQVLKHDFPNVFRPGGIVGANFERDVMAGSTDGWQILSKRVPLNNDEEVIQAIAGEIQLLREARRHGPTSYFAYRMGVLASLTAQAMLPYGFPWTPEEQELRRLVISDIESHIDTYGFSVAQKNREFVRNAPEYFRQRRSFHAEDKRLIANDYERGVGYEGFLKQGGRAYFIRAVETVADVWNTVLRADSAGAGFALAKPSPRSLTWYFVDEMEYLVNVKNNQLQIEKVYKNFEEANPRLTEAYEYIADVFYAHPDEVIKMRGVAEWQKAYDLGGPERSRIGRKLSGHYMSEGRSFLERAGQPDAEETDLNNALNAFERSLDYDRSSDMAAQLIQETHVAIKERNERLEVILNIIATGERIHEEANRFREARDFANAISTFRQSIGFFEAVDDEFKEQSKTAREKIIALRREIGEMIADVLDAASQAIDDGDRARDTNQFEDSLAHYQRVPGIVAVIPDDESADVLRDKSDVIELANRKIDETNVAKLRYEQAQAEQAQQAAQQQQQR